MTIRILLIVCVALMSGCSTGIVSMGKDEFMVSHKGSAYSTESALKAKCLKDANRYCEERGLEMTVVSTIGHDPAFGVMGVCELVFKASPTNSLSKP